MNSKFLSLLILGSASLFASVPTQALAQVSASYCAGVYCIGDRVEIVSGVYRGGFGRVTSADAYYNSVNIILDNGILVNAYINDLMLIAKGSVSYPGTYPAPYPYPYPAPGYPYPGRYPAPYPEPRYPNPGYPRGPVYPAPRMPMPGGERGGDRGGDRGGQRGGGRRVMDESVDGETSTNTDVSGVVAE